MRASLYEALGIPPTASDEEVRAALRRLIRKYYAKTRDGQGNVEEALRFINHASRILSDPDRRRRYNNELLRSDGTAERPSRMSSLIAMSASGEGPTSRSRVGDSARRTAASLDARSRARDADIARNHPSSRAHRARRPVRPARRS